MASGVKYDAISGWSTTMRSTHPVPLDSTFDPRTYV